MEGAPAPPWPCSTQVWRDFSMMYVVGVEGVARGRAGCVFVRSVGWVHALGDVVSPFLLRYPAPDDTSSVRATTMNQPSNTDSSVVDAAAGAGADAATADALPCYDTLAVLTAMAATAVDGALIDEVADATGHMVITTLDVLRRCGVSGLAVVAVRKALTPPSVTSDAVRIGADHSHPWPVCSSACTF